MERRKRRVRVVERRERLVGGLVQVKHRPGGDEEGGVGAAVSVSAGVVVDDLAFVPVGLEFVVEERAEAVELPKVQRAEVEEEVPVDEIGVDVEEVGRGSVLREGAEGDIVEAIL